MMLPARRWVMASAACFMPSAAPSALTRSTRSNSPASNDRMLLAARVWRPSTPALLHSTSNRPYRATARSTARSTSSSTDTSHRTNPTCGPSAAASASPAASSMSAITTLAPCFTNSLTIASPIPLAPPVTMATFPSSL
ncbi:Os03g0299400, partial [Oryza sativa Japonica Group]